MKAKFFLHLFLLFSIISCTTLQFGKQERIYSDDDEKDTNQVREFDLSYSYKAAGIPIKGDKSVVEAFFEHPDKSAIFICISFPKIGILRTEDNGKTFTSNFFKLGFLDKIYGYSDEDKRNEGEEEKKTEDDRTPVRFFHHFKVSPKDPNKIAITMGPYLLISNDKGTTWESKKLFFNMESVKIRDLIITEKEELIVITKNQIAVSSNWGKKWKRHFIKIDKTPPYKINYITGYYDDSSSMLLASIQNYNEPDSLLSQKSFEYFYNDQTSDLKSGVYYSTDLGETWQKSSIPVPVALWNYKNKIYGAPIYPLGFYRQKFSEKFMKTKFYKSAKLDNSTQMVKEFADILLKQSPEEYEIISKKNNKLVTFTKIDKKLAIISEKNFNNLYNGIKKIQNLDAIQWEDLWYKKRKSSNFFYEYNFIRFFKSWTGMRTNGPVLLTKDEGRNIYYRIRPHDKFLKTFIKYSIEKQIKINSINPFLRRKTDLEFFEPQLDPTNGFPIIIEYSKDSGKSWRSLYNGSELVNILDPLGKKRSGFYWFKNIDQKKIIKLQVSFGFDQGINFIVYPLDIKLLGKDIAIQINYFSITKTYKDLYLFPKK